MLVCSLEPSNIKAFCRGWLECLSSCATHIIYKNTICNIKYCKIGTKMHVTPSKSGGSLQEEQNASPSLSFRLRKRALRLGQQHPPAVACGPTSVTSVSPLQPPPHCTLRAGSSTWCTTILPRHGEKPKGLCFTIFVQEFRSECSHNSVNGIFFK